MMHSSCAHLSKRLPNRLAENAHASTLLGWGCPDMVCKARCIAHAVVSVASRSVREPDACTSCRAACRCSNSERTCSHAGAAPQAAGGHRPRMLAACGFIKVPAALRSLPDVLQCRACIALLTRLLLMQVPKEMLQAGRYTESTAPALTAPLDIP